MRAPHHSMAAGSSSSSSSSNRPSCLLIRPPPVGMFPLSAERTKAESVEDGAEALSLSPTKKTRQ